MLWRSGGLSTISMSVCVYIRIYLAVYGPEIIDGFVLEEKSQKRKRFVVSEEQTMAFWGMCDLL